MGSITYFTYFSVAPGILRALHEVNKPEDYYAKFGANMQPGARSAEELRIFREVAVVPIQVHRGRVREQAQPTSPLATV